MGAVAWAIWQRLVSHPRSSNWTCGFPASGFPTGFTVRPAISCQLRAANAQRVRVYSPRDTVRSDRSGHCRCLQAKGQSPDITVFTSAPEVRALSSAGATRLHRSYDPVRLPLAAPSKPALRPLPPAKRVSPDYSHHPSGVPRPLPRRIERVRASIASPSMLPSPFCRRVGMSLLSRPAQASRALRPVGLLNRPRRPSSRGSSPSGCPSRPLVGYQSNRQFSGWYLPPLVIHAFGAHCKNQEIRTGSMAARVSYWRGHLGSRQWQKY